MPGPWPPSRRDRDIDDELAAHLEMATRDHLDRGMAPDAAARAASRDLGNVPLIKQRLRELRRWTRFEQAFQDLRFGTRILRQAPGLSAAAALLVALVVGANTTIYSMVNGILVSPARAVTAPRLVAIKHVEPGATIADPFVSFPNYVDYARLAGTLEQLAAWSSERLTIGSSSGTHAVFGGLVTANYFQTLGVAVALGRGPQPHDEAAADGVVAVISDRLWHDRFAADPGTVGRAVMVNGVPATVVGVAAPGFAGALLTPGEDIWIPIESYYRAIGSIDVLEDRAQPLVAMVGQRHPGLSVSAVRAEFDGLVGQLRSSYPTAFTVNDPRGVKPMANPRASVSDYSAASLLPMADMAPTFLALFSVVTMLTVVIVSANVANLMLGRAVERQQDTAVRLSLGASRLRILRMLASEGLAITAIAWAAACLVAWWTTRLLLGVIEPRAGLLADIRPDWTPIAYAMALAGISTVVFTLAPARRAWRLPVLPLLRRGEASVAHGRSRLSTGLVVLQMALSVLLLTMAGLAYRSLSMLDSGDVGFDPGRLLLVSVRVGRQEAFVVKETSPEARRADLAMLERVRQRIAQEPGVQSVSYTRRMPGPYALEPMPVRIADDTRATAFVRSVGPAYLQALGLRPVAGREIGEQDIPGAPRTAVVNQHLADTLFAGRSAIGQTVYAAGDAEGFEIVGVAPAALVDGPVHDRFPRYLFVAQQQAQPRQLIDMTFYIRHDRPLDELTPRLGRAIAEVDPALPIVTIAPMTARLAEVTELQGEITAMVFAFAIGAFVIAALGQYAVAMFNMRRRTRDLGLRIALGASPRQIERSIIGEGFTLMLPGLAIGLLLATGLAVVFRAVLFGVTPVDAVTYAGVAVVVGAASLVASYLPARRAGRISVMDALRHE
jgi:predicted permease